MSRPSIEMFHYPTVVAQIRQGASDRETARGAYMGCRKLPVREVTDKHGWLDAPTPLPDDAQIAAAGSAPKPLSPAPSTAPSGVRSSGLTP